MKYRSGAAVAALLLATTPCWAWNNTTSGPGPQQINDTVPGAQAVSRSHARGGAGGAGGAGGVGGMATVNVYGSTGAPGPGAAGATAGPAGAGNPWGGAGSRPWFDPTYPVGSAIAPPMTSYNSCAGSPTSGAAQFAPFGLSFGTGGGFDNACRLNQSGHPNVAFAYLCEVNSDVRKAALAAHDPCPQDVPPQQVVHRITDYPYDWCGTRNAGDKNQHKECDQPLQVTTQR